MPWRSVIISEEFGVYRLSCRDGSVTVTGKNAEDVLTKAGAKLGLTEPPHTFEGSELIEGLMGYRSESSLQTSERS